MRSAQVDKLCVRETKVLQAMQNDETVQHEATHTCFVPRPIESIQSNPQPTPLGISFVWQTWKQTQLISYQSNFSAYASNLHVINLCDKVKCRTVDTGCFGGVVREGFHFFSVLHCSLDSCKVICDVVALSLYPYRYLHICQIVGKYDLYALAKFVSVHGQAEIIYIDAWSKINCCSNL